MAEEIRFIEKLVFGSDAARCEITGRIFETGIGSPSRQIQQARFIEDEPASFDLRPALEALILAEPIKPRGSKL